MVVTPQEIGFKNRGDRLKADDINALVRSAKAVMRGTDAHTTLDGQSSDTSTVTAPGHRWISCQADIDLPKYSVLGMGTLSAWTDPVRISIGKIGPSEITGNPLQYFTNGVFDITESPKKGWVRPIEYNEPVLLAVDSVTAPTIGNLCGLKPNSFVIADKYTGFICLSDVQDQQGTDVVWVMLWQSTHVLVEAVSDIPFLDVETEAPGEGTVKILQRDLDNLPPNVLLEDIDPLPTIPVWNIGGLIEDKSSPIFAVPTLGVGLVVDNPLQFGTANGVITAGTTTGEMNVFGMNAGETALVDKGMVQVQVHFLHLNKTEGTPEDISDGKEVAIEKVNGRWHIFHAECENAPASETPMKATALKTTTPDSPFQAVPGDLVLVDSTGGDFTVDAPLTPDIDNRFGVLKVVGQANNFVIVDAGTDTIIPLSNISPPGSPTTAALQAAFELGIWRWNGTEWHVENNAHTPALVQVYRVKALPIIGLGVGVVLQWDFVPIFTGQTQTAILLETGTFVDSRFNIKADLTADVELSFNFDHRLTGNNQNTQFNVTNNYQAASGPGILLMGATDAPYADPRTVTVSEDKDKKGVMFSRATDTLEFTASGAGTGLIDLIGAIVTFTIG